MENRCGKDRKGKAECSLISVDWGTTSMGCCLLSRDGEIIDSADAPDGILALADGSFDDALRRHTDRWLARHDVPILLSGMIGSRNGWVETPYLPTPVGRQALADAIIVHTRDDGRRIHFVAGIRHDDGRRIEVMRGEETQIVGAFAEGLEDGSAAGLFVLPGTHSKWAEVENGLVTGFTTYMTGDVFSALLDHTILRTLPRPTGFARDAFLRGVAAALSPDCGLLSDLFQIRTGTLFNVLPPEDGADYLSGLLIGQEVRAGLARWPKDFAITIIGRSALADRYEAALAHVGRETRRAPSDTAAKGALSIARAARLIT